MSDPWAAIGVGSVPSAGEAEDAAPEVTAAHASRQAWVRSTRIAALAREATAIALLVAIVLVSFRDSILSGLVAAEKDTRVFFYPLHLWIAEEVRAGRIPLWNPYIFTGYPMLADGEMGLANPIQLALLHLLQPTDSFIWQRVCSVAIAAVGAYALCRALRLTLLASIVGGLTFSLGSFFGSQIHHENVTRTAAWLPLVLACVEWSLRRPGWRRHLWLTLAAMALGMAAVGLHPQILAMMLLAFAVFVVGRVALGPIGNGEARPVESKARAALKALRTIGGRAALILWIGGYVGSVGLALGAVQLFPLAELGAATYRGSNPYYFFATSYALPLQNLVNLVLPYFFRGADSQYWSLWAKWETTLYVGIAPLALAVLALASRRRETLIFVVLAVGGLWLAFADYAPVDLYHSLWQLPGFSAFRVPGRYTYLFVLAAAVLAAFGLDALRAEDRGGLRRRLLILGLVVGMSLGSFILYAELVAVRDLLLIDPTTGVTWIRESYLSLRHSPEGIDLGDVYRGLLHTLSLETPRTAFAVVTVPLVLTLTLGAAFGRGFAPIGRVALTLVAVADLVWFGIGLHDRVPASSLNERTAAVAFLDLCGRSGPSCPSDGPDTAPGAERRVFTPGTISALEFDRLVPYRIEDVGGYSSAEPRRNFSYWTTIASVQNRLLDIANVRYVVYPARNIALPSYADVPFDPERPLMLSGKDALGSLESYSFGGWPADRIKVVAALTRAVHVPAEDVVAEVRVVSSDGVVVPFQLRAGRHVGEWAYDRPDVRGTVAHPRPPVIAFRRPDRFELDGTPYERYFYYSEFDLPEQLSVDRVEIQYVHPQGGIELYGLGIFNFDSKETLGAYPRMQSRLREVYADDQAVIMENTTAFPRAYVVPRSRVSPSETSLAAMLDTPFDPTTEVMLPQAPGAPLPSAAGPTPATGLGVPEGATLLEAEPNHVRYRASSETGGYFVHVANLLPGWRAWVDGVEQPFLLANALFRAVPVNPGEHVVEMRYEPESVQMGVVVSLWAALVGCLTVAAAFAYSRLRSASSVRGG